MPNHFKVKAFDKVENGTTSELVQATNTAAEYSKMNSVLNPEAKISLKENNKSKVIKTHFNY